MRLSSLVMVVTVVAGLGAACSGGDDEASSTTVAASSTVGPTTAPSAASSAPPTEPPTTIPTTTEPTTTAPPTTVPVTTVPPTTVPEGTEPADPLAAVAATALLTFDDFASGWSEDPADDEADDDATGIVAECADVDPALIGNDVLGTSRVEAGFTTVDETFSVDHSVGFAADEAAAAEAFAAITDPDVPDCYGEAVRQFFEQQMNSDDPADTLPPGLEIGEATATVGDFPGSTLQSEAYRFHVEYPLTLGDQTFDQHADFVFLRNGAALSRIMLTGFGQPFPAEDIEGIVELADAKLAAIA